MATHFGRELRFRFWLALIISLLGGCKTKEDVRQYGETGDQKALLEMLGQEDLAPYAILELIRLPLDSAGEMVVHQAVLLNMAKIATLAKATEANAKSLLAWCVKHGQVDDVVLLAASEGCPVDVESYLRTTYGSITCDRPETVFKLLDTVRTDISRTTASARSTVLKDALGRCQTESAGLPFHAGHFDTASNYLGGYAPIAKEDPLTSAAAVDLLASVIIHTVPQCAISAHLDTISRSTV